MSKGMLLVGIILLGMCTLAVVNVVNNYQTGNELDYYLLEETTEGAMIDAVDIPYYRITGVVRIDREMFLENFIRRLANNVDKTRTYDVRIVDFNETPPKVSIQINSNTVASVKAEQATIINKLDAILETKYNETRTIDDIENKMSSGKGSGGSSETIVEESNVEESEATYIEEEIATEESGS